jgi:DNA polymerase III epsilon subunit-like protein
MIVVDVETSGLDPHHNSILSIGSVEFGRPDNQFYLECQVDPDAAVEPKALAVNGFSEEQIVDPAKPSLRQALVQWLEWTSGVDDRTLAGHNTWFDYRMLEAACRKYDLGWPFGMRVVDTHSLAYAHYLSRGVAVPQYGGSSGITTDVVFEYVGLAAEPKPHHGLVGAQMEAEALSRFVSGKSLLADYASLAVPEYLKQGDQHE